MSKIDPISAALGTKTAFDLLTGKQVYLEDGSLVDNDTNKPALNIEAQVVDSVNQDESDDKTDDEIDEEELQDEIFVKENLRTLIKGGMDLAEDMFEFVRMSENPKSFEPAAAYLKSVAELNEKLLAVYDRKNKNKPVPVKGSVVNNTQNNTVICKSPADLLKMLGEMEDES